MFEAVFKKDQHRSPVWNDGANVGKFRERHDVFMVLGLKVTV